MLRRGIREERGATVVEFALGATVFFLLVLMIMQGALTFHGWLAVTQAAREAARFGAPCYQRPVNACSDSDITAVVLSRSATAVMGTVDNVQVQLVTDPVTNLDMLEVSLQYHPEVIAPLVDAFIPDGLTLPAASAMRLENQT